jgi:response regulator RpfG family c-di-GMP phosphodiesterase
MRERVALYGGSSPPGLASTAASGSWRHWRTARTPMIRVVIVDDQAPVTGGFAALLGSVDDMVVVGEAANGREAAALVTRTQPDVVLMDIRMPSSTASARRG